MSEMGEGRTDGLDAPGGGTDHGMTDLEESLRGPDGLRVCSAVLARLTDLTARIDARIGSGLRPDQYARAQAIRNCVATAREMMLRVAPMGR